MTEIEKDIVVFLAGDIAAGPRISGDEWVALHEAGHVVVGLAVGLPMPYSASIRPDPVDGSQGRVEDRDPALRPEWASKMRAQSDRRAAIWLAAAEVGGSRFRPVRELLRRLQRVTGELVAEHSGSIRVLALRLQERGKMLGPEMAEVIAEAAARLAAYEAQRAAWRAEDMKRLR